MRQFIKGLLVLLVLGIAGSAHAQTLGTIAGAAKDATGAVLPGVSVEVSSPVLIEKIRTAVTDGSGQYAVVSLPVGTYTVTFSLPGFSTVKREGIELTANFTATINAEMVVGAVAETVTVTGQTPLVDVQGAITTRAVTPDLIKSIPNGGTMYQLAAMMPGVYISGGQDVGGSSGSPVGAQLSTHGGTGNDEVQMLDGVRVGNMMGGSRTQQTLSPLLYDEVDVQLSGQAGDAVSLGVTSNSIPRSGGNRFSGTVLANGSGPGLQTSNLTSRLQSLGLTTSASLRSLFDVAGSIGGPIVKDRLWFYATERYQTNSTNVPGSFFSANPLPTPGNLTRVASSEQGYNPQYLWDNTFRVTAAATSKLRVNGLAIVQRKWWPFFPGPTSTVSPESVTPVTWPGRIYQGSATYAATSRLLFEGGMNYQDSSDWWEPVPQADNRGGNAVRVVEQGTTLANGTVIAPITWGPMSPSAVSDNPMKMIDARAAMNYVTGTHSIKVGLDLQHGYRSNSWLNMTTPIQYRTLGYQLNQVTIFAPLGTYQANLDYDAGIFAQDRWTLKRLSVTAALRLDLQKESYEPTVIGPTLYLPNRATQTIPGADVVDWKDINPRFGVSYDLFGDGKTAVKASAARGVAGETIATVAALNPGGSFSSSTAINVTDGNRNNIPDCDFTKISGSVGNGECGPWLTPTFGSAIPVLVQDPATLSGWNNRPWNWEFSAGVQREVSPRVSAGITYYRRINGGFLVTDNTATVASDYTPYNLTVPTDSRLPLSGQSLTYYDVNPVLKSGAGGTAVSNRTTFASNYGNQYQHWNGVDITGTSRLAAGITANGGVTFGKQMLDNCDLVSKLPELLTTPLAGLSPLQMCHFESGWAPQYKLLGSYTLPWQNIRISGNLQSIPGPVRQASSLYTQAQITSALGRPATVAGNKSALVIEPYNAVGFFGTDFGDRLNQLDLRFSKIFKFGSRSTVDANFDIYNAFNSDAVLTESATYSGTNGGAWLLPTSVIQGRIIKFGVRWDF
jgi:Carboxypeptidase regulatory-like domain/TonB-dependent Receptor Plug Domain